MKYISSVGRLIKHTAQFSVHRKHNLATAKQRQSISCTSENFKENSAIEPAPAAILNTFKDCDHYIAITKMNR